jgi:hypothetical protein
MDATLPEFVLHQPLSLRFQFKLKAQRALSGVRGDQFQNLRAEALGFFFADAGDIEELA